MATVLITGANRGIGLEMTRLFAARGDTVIAAVRRPSAELEGLGVRIEAGIDVAKDGAEVLAARLGDLDLDLLVNNAGVAIWDGDKPIDPEAIRTQIEVNAIGPLRVAYALLGRLSAGGKIVNITSRMGSIGDNTSGGSYGYRMSKAALNMASKSLSLDVRDMGVAVAVLHPGWVKTEMTGGTGNVTAAESAAGLLARIDELSLESTGGFWHAEGQTLPW